MAIDKLLRASESVVREVMAVYADRTDDHSRIVLTVCRARLFNLGAQ